MAIEKVINISVNSDEAVKGLDAVDDSIKDIDKNTTDLTSTFDKMSGGLVSGFKKGVSGIKSGVMAFKSLKVAIAATGIGLLVIALGSVYAWFSKTQEGADKLSVIFKQVGAAIDVIVDRVIAVGKVLSNVFSQSFSETIDGVSDSFKGMGDEMERDIRLAKELEEATQKLRDVENDQIVIQAQRRKMIAENRLLAKDQSKTLDERIANLKLAQALENATLEEQKENQAERVRIAEEEYERATSTAEDFQNLQNERARLIDLETDSFNRQRTIVSELESLKNQVKPGGEDVETRDPVKVLETQYENELIVIKAGEDAKTDLILDGIKDRNKKAVALEKAKLQEEELLNKMAENAKLNIAYDAFALVGELAEEGSALAKTAAVAQATISGYQGVQNAFTTASANPITTVFPAFPFIQAGLAGAFSAIQIGKILSAKSDGSGEKPSGNVGGGGGGVSAPSFNLVQGTGSDQISSDIATQNQTPVKAFVVSSDVTTSQALDRNARGNATF